jgi:hypothetical protein
MNDRPGSIDPLSGQCRPAPPINRIVFSSRRPSKYLSSSLWNTDPSAETLANRVAQDLSFMSSGEPKISFAECPSTPRAASAISVSRGPRTGWARYASASASVLMANRREVELNPSPSNCGKTYHIQWLRFRPFRTSASVVS